jgi:energy-converting hydrogenase Eha subunit G
MSPPDTNLDPDLRRRLEGVREADWRPILSLGAVVLFVWLAGFVPWLLQEKDWPWNLDFGL